MEIINTVFNAFYFILGYLTKSFVYLSNIYFSVDEVIFIG